MFTTQEQQDAKTVGRRLMFEKRDSANQSGSAAGDATGGSASGHCVSGSDGAVSEELGGSNDNNSGVNSTDSPSKRRGPSRVAKEQGRPPTDPIASQNKSKLNASTNKGSRSSRKRKKRQKKRAAAEGSADETGEAKSGAGSASVPDQATARRKP